MNRPTLEDYEAASDWLDDAAEGWSPTQRSAFLDWLAGGPARLEAVRRVAQTMADPMLDTALAEALNARPPSAGTPTAPPQDHAPVARPPSRFARMAMAAGLAGLLALGGGGWAWLQRGERLVTEPGAGLVEQLADGSTIHLDGRSELTVHLRAHTRDLDLLQGSGVFEVAHAPDRPFTVRSGDVAVTAVGTVFAVEQVGAATVVRVDKGRVRVRRAGQVDVLDAGQGFYLAPGQRPAGFAFHPASAADPWLEAQGDRLDTVLARLQHASAVPLGCASALAARPVSGRYRLADPEGSLRLIALANGWQVVARNGGWQLQPE